MWRRLGIALFTLVASACATVPPTGWATGGQPLTAPRARWVNGDLLVDLEPTGRVLVGGRHVFTVDATGRVYDAHNQPVALLQRDGMVLGPDDLPMGWVGAGEAILPGDEHSWLILHPSGLLMRSDGDTDKPFGQWLGCQHPRTLQTCTLLSHIIGRQLLSRGDQNLGLTPGLGIGVGTIITP